MVGAFRPPRAAKLGRPPFLYINMNKPIRVGMVSCDTHAIYYAALMAAHNPLKLRQPIAGIDHEHSWMNGSVHFYFYPFCAQPTKPGFEMVEGFQITKVWDRRCEVAEAFAGVFTDRPRVCETL